MNIYELLDLRARILTPPPPHTHTVDYNKTRIACHPKYHDDVIKWKHFPRHWPLVRGIHWTSGNSLYKGQWGGALIFSLICAWTNGWANDWDAGDLRWHRTHCDVTVMTQHRYLHRWFFGVTNYTLLHMHLDLWLPITLLLWWKFFSVIC